MRAERARRLSQKERVIAELLEGKGPAYGLALVHASRGKLRRGTVYVLLRRMEDKGLIEAARPPDDNALTRYYDLTRWCRRVLAAERAAEQELR